MTHLEKVKAGIDYIRTQSNQGLDTIELVESKGFKAKNTKIKTKHEKNLQFRIKFMDSVELLLEDYKKLNTALDEVLTRVQKGTPITPEEINGIKKVLTRLNV